MKIYKDDKNAHMGRNHSAVNEVRGNLFRSLEADFAVSVLT